MKASNFIRHLNNHKCYLHREGSNHSIFINATTKKISSVPRHKEIKNHLVRKICKDLEIPVPSSFQ